WHLAHTTWFWETFVLGVADPDYRPFDSRFRYLFNSYYNAVGEQFPRPSRGLISRPTLAMVLDYRHHVDEAMARLAGGSAPWQGPDAERWSDILALGLNHEQQHQELMPTDLKHLWSINPLSPARGGAPPANPPSRPPGWTDLEGGPGELGQGGWRFGFGYELPPHQAG